MKNLSQQIEVHVKCVAKNVEDGWFFTKRFITFEFIDKDYVPVKLNTITFNMKAEQFYGINVGDEFFMTMYRHSNGLYNIVKE